MMDRGKAAGERSRWALFLAAAMLWAMAGSAPVQAQGGVPVPNFWDPRSRPERPNPAALRQLRFLTDDEFPPLHFAGPDGAPTGFFVELARAACETLAIACSVQVRRFDTLLDSLGEARAGDVVAAAIPLTGDLRRRFAATQTFFRLPARFAQRRDRPMPEPGAAALQGRRVAVVGGTAHEAYLRSYFPQARVETFLEAQGVQGALRRGEVDYAFGDGLTLALWLGGTEAGECCAFVGGAYLESRYFGEGVGFIFRPEDEPLRRAFDYALQKLWDDGKYAELYLRFFPVSPF